ncbi:hypothetical protein Emed_003522 [Eimeria media]
MRCEQISWGLPKASAKSPSHAIAVARHAALRTPQCMSLHPDASQQQQQQQQQRAAANSSSRGDSGSNKESSSSCSSTHLPSLAP